MLFSSRVPLQIMRVRRRSLFLIYQISQSRLPTPRYSSYRFPPF
nr:MAG TPA: hypothetical protein [Caudoviricetes sp.]